MDFSGTTNTDIVMKSSLGILTRCKLPYTQWSPTMLKMVEFWNITSYAFLVTRNMLHTWPKLWKSSICRPCDTTNYSARYHSCASVGRRLCFAIWEPHPLRIYMNITHASDHELFRNISRKILLVAQFTENGHVLLYKFSPKSNIHICLSFTQ